MSKPSPLQARILRALAPSDGLELASEGVPFLTSYGNWASLERPDGMMVPTFVTGPRRRNQNHIGRQTFDVMKANNWLQEIALDKYGGQRFALSERGKYRLDRLKPEDFQSPETPKAPLTAHQIEEALANRHDWGRGWLFLRQVYGVDALAFGLIRSSMYRLIAYEIKVSRADFLRELRDPEKNREMREWADEFYFAAPQGIIKPAELPLGTGLIEVGRHRTKTDELFTRMKVRAPATKLRTIDGLPRRLMASVVYASHRESKRGHDARWKKVVLEAYNIMRDMDPKNPAHRERKLRAQSDLYGILYDVGAVRPGDYY